MTRTASLTRAAVGAFILAGALVVQAQEPVQPSSRVVLLSNKIRLGNTSVTVIEGQVGFTSSSDATKKENFETVDGEQVLTKIRGLSLGATVREQNAYAARRRHTSWGITMKRHAG